MFVYILLCADGTFYTGVTNNVERRFSEHEEGIDERCYTYSRRPLELLYMEFYNSPLDAIQREKQIKGWSHGKKEALIQGDIIKLTELSKCKKSHPSAKLRVTKGKLRMIRGQRLGQARRD
jgi:putative endonuclease